MLQPLIESIKSVIEFVKEPVKLIYIVSWIFFGVCVTFLYNKNSSLEAKISDYEVNCQKLINSARENCEQQISLNRQKNQVQINTFIEKSNMERDSIYRYFYKTIKQYNVKINRELRELNDLKDENNN